MSVVNIDGRVVKADPPALLRYYRETLGVRNALICEKCEELCAIRLADCACCKNFGKSFNGSKRVRRMSPHSLVPVEQVIPILRAAA